MNDAYESVNSVEGADGAPLCVTDLGDAIEETKQMSAEPWVYDNLMQWGWF